MDLETVKQFLEDNKENEDVQAFLKVFNSVDVDDIKAYLEQEEGKKLIQPKLDTYFTRGLQTWKDNNLEKLISEEVSKRNPDETPEQKRIRELEEYVAQKEQETQFQANKNTALNYLNEKKLPSKLVDYFVGNDEETTLKNLGQFEEVFTTQLQKAVESRLKADGTELEGTGNNKTITIEQIQSMTEKEINENWDVVQEAMKNGNK